MLSLPLNSTVKLQLSTVQDKCINKLTFKYLYMKFFIN